MAKQTQLIAVGSKDQTLLSKAQKQFNNYLKKIDKLKTELKNTTEIVTYLSQSVHEHLIPAEQALIAKRVEWVFFLETLFDMHKKLNAKDKEILSSLITAHAFQLIDEFGKDELKPVYEKYQGKSIDEVLEEQNVQTSEMMKSLFGSMMGIEFDKDADLSDPNKFQEYLQQKFMEQEDAFENQQKARKKSKKQIEKEEKEALETQKVNKSVREIYTKLVKEFHPDREFDEAEKVRKTEVMHRITAAYEKNDLMELLRLQLEFEHINQDNINQLADDQLKRYNKVLKEQIDALEDELFWLQGGDDPASPYYRLGEPQNKYMADGAVQNEKQQISQRIEAFEQDFIDLLDLKELKATLKSYHQSQKQQARQAKNLGGLLDIFG